MMNNSNFFTSLLALAICILQVTGKSQTPCKWDSKAGAHYDLRPLTLASNAEAAYAIIDGDIPCTPETEPSFGYSWNFCSNVPNAAVPQACIDTGKTASVVFQHVKYSPTSYYCYILGHYDPNFHELTYELLDPKDPTKGVAIRYPNGDDCSKTSSKHRSATIDVQCANVKSVIVSAQEPELCDYHVVMKSYYGCPTECPVTGNGLCDSHGHCAYDHSKREAYCYCNEEYSGEACDVKGYESEYYDGFSVQLGLLITLLIIALGLTGGIVYLSYQIGEFRKHSITSNYNQLPGGEHEMVETVHFN